MLYSGVTSQSSLSRPHLITAEHCLSTTGTILYHLTQPDQVKPTLKKKQIKVSLLSSRLSKTISPFKRRGIISFCHSLQFASHNRRLCSVGFWVTWFSVEGNIGASVSSCVLGPEPESCLCRFASSLGLIHTR